MTQSTASPRPLAEAGVGDHVLVRSPVGYAERARVNYHNLAVKRAGKRMLLVGGTWYYRASGKPRTRRVRSRLIEPSAANVTAYNAYRELRRHEEAEYSRQQYELNRTRLQQAECAAEWLRKQATPTIVNYVGIQNLIDVYDCLHKEGHL